MFEEMRFRIPVFSLFCIVILGCNLMGCMQNCRQIGFSTIKNEMNPEVSLIWSGDITKFASRRGVVYVNVGDIESYAALSRVDDKAVCFEARQVVPSPDPDTINDIKKRGLKAFDAKLVYKDKELELLSEGSVIMTSEVMARYKPRIPPGSTRDGLVLQQEPEEQELFIVIQGVMCFPLPELKLNPQECIELHLGPPGAKQSYCWEFI